MPASTKELFGNLRSVQEGVRRAVGMLPNTESTIASDFTRNVHHASAETLLLIDRVMRGEQGILRPVTDSAEQFQDYVHRFGERNKGDVERASEYVIVIRGGKRFLGFSELVQRDLAAIELRTIYGIPDTYSDEQVLMAKRNGQLQGPTSDIGVKISFSSMPLHAIHEVQNDTTQSSKLAAGAAASVLLTAAEYTKRALQEYQAGCHDASPELSYSDAHFTTPLSMALAAATNDQALDQLLIVTAGTTKLIQDNSNPTLTNIIHMHHTPADRAALQVQTVSESGIIGGTNIFDLTFWMMGWDKVIDGVPQSALRQQFQVSEIRPVDALHMVQGVQELTPTERANTTVFTGLVGTASGNMDRLQHQMGELSKRRSLDIPVRDLFKGRK